MAATHPRSARHWAIALMALLLAVIGIAAWAAFIRPAERGRSASSARPSAADGQPRQGLLDPALLAEGLRGEVSVPGLGIAGAPGVAPFARIEEGQAVAIIGQRRDGGALWHLVQAPYRGAQLFGWVPDTLGGRPTLSPLPVAGCRDPSLGWIGSLDPPDRLRCWGNQQVSIQGWAVEAGRVEAYLGRPEWLASAATVAITLAIGPAVDGPALEIHLPPGVGMPPLTPRDGPAPDMQVRITAHFDDERAADCVHEPDLAGVPPIDDELSAYWCRQRLVVDSWELVAAE